MPYPRRKLQMPVLHDVDNNINCKLVPIATGLIPFFRVFWDSMRHQGAWETPEDWQRARRYFGWQERMMLCNLENKLEEQKANDNSNMCALIAMVIMSLTEGAIPIPVAMTACTVIKDGVLANGDGSTEDIAAQTLLDLILEAAIGKNTNQMEPYTKVLTELIGGSGVVPDVD
jgi:hypothetical protein